MSEIIEESCFTINQDINNGYPYLKEQSTEFIQENEEGINRYPYNYKTDFTVNPKINNGYPYLRGLPSTFLEIKETPLYNYKAYLGDIPIVKIYYGDVEVTNIL